MKNISSGFICTKIIVLLILISLLTTPANLWSTPASAFETSSNTKIMINIPNWNDASVNLSETTDRIADVHVQDIREQIDNEGNRNQEVEHEEVVTYAERLGHQLDNDFSQNQEKESHIFPMLIDGYYGTFNRTSVYFKDMEGSVTSTKPVLFAIEIFLDFDKTNAVKETHVIKINIGEIFEPDKVYFNTVQMTLPQDWVFNTSMIDPEFPNIFYNNDNLMNITSSIYTQHFAIGEYLKVTGLSTLKYSGPANGNDNGNGVSEDGDKSGKDDDEKFLWFFSKTELIITVIVIIVCTVVVFFLYRRYR